jgi:hypothetical protein
LIEYWSENREEIAGVKISIKGRVKNIARKMLGRNADTKIRKIQKVIKR